MHSLFLFIYYYYYYLWVVVVVFSFFIWFDWYVLCFNIIHDCVVGLLGRVLHDQNPMLLIWLFYLPIGFWDDQNPMLSFSCRIMETFLFLYLLWWVCVVFQYCQWSSCFINGSFFFPITFYIIRILLIFFCRLGFCKVGIPCRVL